MRLEHIKVSGFKSFKEIDLELRSLNVLIGANGSGKSNFISMFRMLNSMVTPGLGLQTHVAEHGGAEVFLHYGSKVTKQLDINLQFGGNLYRCVLGRTVRDSLYFLKEYALLGKTIADSYGEEPNLGKGHRESNLLSAETERRYSGMMELFPEVLDSIQFILENLRSWRVFHFHDTSDSSEMKNPRYINDVEYFRTEGENLAAFLHLLSRKYTDYYASIRSVVQSVAPFFDDFVFQTPIGREDRVQLDWRERGSDYPFQAHQLSDGSLRFICLATVLNLPDEFLPATILIDEPEIGLHPTALSILAALIRKAAFRTQVIVSTQSVQLVNEFAPEDLLVVNRRGGASTIERLEPSKLESWLEDYSLGELWEKNVIGGKPSR